MSFLRSIQIKLIVFNLIMFIIFLIIVLKNVKRPDMFDIILLIILPMTSYALIKRCLED